MEKLLTIREVCDTLKITSRTLHRYVKKGKLDSIKLGSARRFRQQDIKTIIEKGM